MKEQKGQGEKLPRIGWAINMCMYLNLYLSSTLLRSCSWSTKLGLEQQIVLDSWKNGDQELTKKAKEKSKKVWIFENCMYNRELGSNVMLGGSGGVTSWTI